MGEKISTSTQKSETLSKELLALISSPGGQEKGLKKALQSVQHVLLYDAVVALHFTEQDHSYRLIEQVGLSAKQRRGIESILPYVSDYAARDKKHPLPAKNDGTVMIFTENETRSYGINSIFIYYLVKSDRIIGALVFCRNKGQFKKTSFKVLGSIAPLIILLIENTFYKEKAHSIASFVNLDGLTGLYNHRYFQENLSNELLKSQRFDYPVSLLMIDIDHFKDYNDKYSHPKGDAALKEIAGIIRDTVRAYDVSARYGGEEFAVILPYVNNDQALKAADRIRKNVWACMFPGKDTHEKARLTVSIGLATYPNNAKTKADLIDRADQALYLAKSEGRNRVCLSLASSSEFIKVGFCPPAFTSTFYRDIQAGLEDVIREIKRIELSVHAPKKESDYHALKQIFRQLVEEKPDAVAICSQYTHIIKDLDILHKAEIPVFFFNVPEKISDRAICSYIGYDQREAGRIAAKYLARLLRGRGNIAILEGLPEPTNRLRVSGFKEALQNYPNVKIVMSEKADWMLDLARTKTEYILNKQKDLDAIFATSDEMALGAVEAAKNKKKLGEIFIIGLDGTKDALQSIKDGLLTATLNTNPRKMGRILLRTIVRSLIKEEKIESQILSPINIVDLENVDNAMNP